MSLFDGILPDDSNIRGNVLDAVQAMGMGMMQGDRNHFFGTNLAQNLAAIQAGNKAGMSQQALEALLIQRGFSPADAKKFSQSETAAKLAIDGKDAEKYAGIASGLGGVSNLGAPIPKLSPDAPPGPAAGASLNGGGQIPGSLDTSGIQGDTAIRTILAEAGNQGPDGMKAVAGVLRNRALLAGTDLNTEALKPNQFEPWNAGSGNDPRRFKPDSPEYKAAVAAAMPVLMGQEPDPTGGATHFYAPKAQAALGRKAPSWDDGSGVDIGGHRFFRRPYAGQDPSVLAKAAAGKPDQVADATGTAPISPVTRSDVPSLPAGASGLNPNRPVQVANDEAQTQALEGRMGMYPSNVYGITKQATATPQGGVSAADMPVPGAKPAEFQIPPAAGQDPTQNKTVAAIAIARQRQREALQQQIDRNEQIGSQLAAGGEKYYKPYQDRIKRTNDALQKQIDKLDEVKTDFEPDPVTGGVRPVIGGKNDPNQIRAEAQARAKEDSDKLTAAYEQRTGIADRLGLNSEERKMYLATGKLPKEEDKALSAGDRKAIFDAEDRLPALESTIGTLQRAKELNPHAYSGMLAAPLSTLGAKAPDWMVPDFIADKKGSLATAEFNKLMSGEAVTNMSSTLKGATTDAEMRRFVDIMADPSTSPEIRGRTIDRMLTLAQRQQQIANDRINQLKGKTYFKPKDDAPVATSEGAASPARPPAMPDIVERKTVGNKTYARTSDGRVFEVSH